MSTLTAPSRSDHDSQPRIPLREPPPNPLQAVARHPFLTLIPIVVLVGAAVALGLARQPTYTAESRVSVGNLSPSEQTAPGIVDANEQLASSYSRAITAQSVVRVVSRRTHLPRGEVAGHLSASPIAKSPIVTIKGTGDTSTAAVRLAVVSTDALVAYVRSISNSNAGSNAALQRYQAA